MQNYTDLMVIMDFPKLPLITQGPCRHTDLVSTKDDAPPWAPSTKFLIWHLHQARDGMALSSIQRETLRTLVSQLTMTGDLHILAHRDHSRQHPGQNADGGPAALGQNGDVGRSKSVQRRLPDLRLAFGFYFLFFNVSFESRWLEARSDKARVLPEHPASSQLRRVTGGNIIHSAL